MKKLLFTIIVCLFSLSLLSQSCLPEGITFNTQEQIDNFQTENPNCTEIEGNVRIEGNNITNLNGLNVVTSIGGYLMVGYNNGLTSLTGLDNVTSIGGDLNIWSNIALTSLTGLSNVTSIGEYLQVYGNDALTSLVGLDNLTSIGGDLDIASNIALSSLTGLSNVTSIGGDVGIFGNEALISLAGLESLTFIEGDLGIAINYELISLSGLDNVTSIGEDVSIFGNKALTSLAGLDNVTSIGGDLWISENDALASLTGLNYVTSIAGFLIVSESDSLTSLAGLDNIEAASIDSLFIHDNIFLSTCEVQSICDYLIAPNGATEIHNNAEGCNSEQEVQEACWLVHIEDGYATESQIIIYPNPVTTNARLSGEFASSGTVNICIFNTTGSCLKSWEFNNQQTSQQEFTLDLSNLPPGIYFLRLQAGNEMVTKKVVRL